MVEVGIEKLRDKPQFLEEVSGLCSNEWGYLFHNTTESEWRETFRNVMISDTLSETLVLLDSISSEDAEHKYRYSDEKIDWRIDV